MVKAALIGIVVFSCIFAAPNARAVTVYEATITNNVSILSCKWTLHQRIFTVPQQVHHYLDYHSVHFWKDTSGNNHDQHETFSIGIETDAIEGPVHTHSVPILSAPLSYNSVTEFYSVRCIPNGIIERERTKSRTSGCAS
jgi:hypothetical protein